MRLASVLLTCTVAMLLIRAEALGQQQQQQQGSVEQQPQEPGVMVEEQPGLPGNAPPTVQSTPQQQQYEQQPYPAFYPPPPPPPGFNQPAAPPGYHRHDGTYVRMHLGGGYLTTSSRIGTSDVEVSGGAVALGIAVGGAVTENLIIFGEFFFLNADDPTFKTNGQVTPVSGVSLSTGGIGPGLAYYLQPSNVYLSATVGFGNIQLQTKETSRLLAETDLGLSLSGMVGKEWWVSENWGLGLALQFHLGRSKDKVTVGSPPIFYSNAIALVMSATFN